MLSAMVRRDAWVARGRGGLPEDLCKDPWFEEGRADAAAPSRTGLSPRAIAIVSRVDAVERFVSAFSRQSMEVHGFTDADSALQEFQRGRYDLAFVGVTWGDEFERSLIATLHEIDPDIAIIALARTDEAVRALDADYDLRVAAVLAEPWTPASLLRAVRSILYPKEQPDRVVEGALCPISPSPGFSRLLPFTLPALLRLAGDLLFPKPARQGALHHTPQPLTRGAA